MTVLEYLLDGLEAELALERELGVRSVEIDRSLLTAARSEELPGGRAGARPSRAAETGAAMPDAQVAQPKPVMPRGRFDFVFLHDGPLSEKGVAMMEKIVAAMGMTAETAPVVWEKPVPRAAMYVVLGFGALRKWFPGRNASPGMWIKSEKGVDILVTYSPEYILRFATVTPRLKKIKADMWTSLKGVVQRASLLGP